MASFKCRGGAGPDLHLAVLDVLQALRSQLHRLQALERGKVLLLKAVEVDARLSQGGPIQYHAGEGPVDVLEHDELVIVLRQVRGHVESTQERKVVETGLRRLVNSRGLNQDPALLDLGFELH